MCHLYAHFSTEAVRNRLRPSTSRYTRAMRNAQAHALVRYLTANPGAATRTEIERRWSRNALDAALRARLVVRVLPEAYAATLHADALLARAQAAHLWAGPGSVIIGAGAAAAWGLTGPPNSVTVAVPYGTQKPCPPWLRLRRTGGPPLSAMWHQVPVAIPELAVLTAYGELDHSAADRALYRAVNEGLVTAESLAAAERALPRLARRRDVRRAIEAVAQGAESPLESHALQRVFNLGEFASFVRQHDLTVEGVRYRADMYDAATRTAVELDGGTHAEPEQRLRDLRRDARLAAAGIVTLRFAGRDLLRDPEWCRNVVRQTLRQRVRLSDT